MANLRIGHGYDVHRLTEGRDLIIGGVKIPYEKGLLGHSDADVLTHAIMDAILGALGFCDIGVHFPDTDPAYKSADSLKLLACCVDKLKAAGFRIGNIDSTIIAQNPKMAPFTPEMRQKLAKVLEAEVSQVNVKATTEEGLGFTGEGEAIAAHAVALIEK